MEKRLLDLRSDTVTQPTDEMRKAMFHAEVGDDMYGDDPTLNELQRVSAEICGKEAGLFNCSGLMGNQVAIMTHCARGSEIIISADAHIMTHEVGAPAVLAGVMTRTLSFENGIPDPDAIARAVRTDDLHGPKTSLICVEQALLNGRVVPMDIMRAVHAVGKKYGVPVHIDGARLFNAAEALGVDAREIADCGDTVQFCLSKGLCAPMGSVLTGSREFISRAWRNRRMCGGSIRQGGFMAAAGLVALRDMRARLRSDHENARYFAERIAALPKVECDPDACQINMVYFSVNAGAATLAALNGELEAAGVIPPVGESNRYVFHWPIEKSDAAAVADIFEKHLK